MVVAAPSLAVGESPKTEQVRKDNFQESIGKDAHNRCVEDTADFVKKLPVEFREALCIELLRELRRHRGPKCVIPLVTPDGEDLGHFTPPGWPIEYPMQKGPKLTKELEAEFQRRLEHLDEAIPIEQGLAELIQRVADLQHQST